MKICGENLQCDWYEVQNTRQFFFELERSASTLLLHNLLTALEQRIVDRLVSHYGEKGLKIWDSSFDVDDDEEICEAVSGHWTDNYAWLHSIAARRDSAEIRALMEERAS